MGRSKGREEGTRSRVWMVPDLPGSKMGRQGGLQLPLVLREWTAGSGSGSLEPGAEACGQAGGLDEAGCCEEQVGRTDKLCSWLIMRIKR